MGGERVLEGVQGPGKDRPWGVAGWGQAHRGKTHCDFQRFLRSEMLCLMVQKWVGERNTRLLDPLEQEGKAKSPVDVERGELRSLLLMYGSCRINLSCCVALWPIEQRQTPRSTLPAVERWTGWREIGSEV